MALEITAPQDFDFYLRHEYVTIFAGGSIEIGKAKPWQHRLVSAFRDCDDVVILNPRRPIWKQDKKTIHQQVIWELSGLERCDAIIMYFDPATKSPISLLELGLFGNDFGNEPDTLVQKMHVVCPCGFWRKTNVDIVCERYCIPQFSSLTAAINQIKTHLDDYRRVFIPYDVG